MFAKRSHFIWTAISICLVTFLLRFPITQFSVLIKQISQDIPLTNTEIGIIVSLPTFIMGLLSFAVDSFNRRVGVVYSLLISLILIIVGLFVRDVVSNVQNTNTALNLIYLGIFIITLGITLMSVLYPVFINTFFKKQVGVMMAINSTNLSVSALAGTFSALLLVGMGWHWRAVGIFWLVVSCIILAIYLPTIYFTKQFKPELEFTGTDNQQDYSLQENNKVKPMYTQPVAWFLALALGLESIDFFFIVSWWQSNVSQALTINQLNILLNGFQVLCIPAGLATPIIFSKFAKHTMSFIVVNVSILCICAIAILFTTNFGLLAILLAIIGITSGSLITVYFTVLALKAVTPVITAKLSGFALAISFLITASFLFGFGALIDLTGSNNIAYAVYVVCNILLPICTYLGCKLNLKKAN